jgi:hypothetical protein
LGDPPEFLIFLILYVLRLKILISWLAKHLQGSTTPQNEPESSHYGRRSMVSEPYLDRKKSYGPLKFLNPQHLAAGDVGRNFSKI